MDAKSEIRDFLTSRRARITPQEAGLKVFGPRRVPGLRREEVATLAGLSVDYYNRLERGNLGAHNIRLHTKGVRSPGELGGRATGPFGHASSVPGRVNRDHPPRVSVAHPSSA